MARPQRIAPGPGQESVWDYPRPPAIEPVTLSLRVEHGGKIIASAPGGWRVLETSHPPVYYLSQDSVTSGLLRPNDRATFCEWKGRAMYWDLIDGDVRIADVAWSYPRPNARFAAITDHLAFYASRVDACWVGDERVQAQAGDFYGGWITSAIVGPFKGSAGTWGW
jgi:uncharacterized protein (DUF427 family)